MVWDELEHTAASLTQGHGKSQNSRRSHQKLWQQEEQEVLPERLDGIEWGHHRDKERKDWILGRLVLTKHHPMTSGTETRHREL